MTEAQDHKSGDQEPDKYSAVLIEVVSTIEAWQDQFGETYITIMIERPHIAKHPRHFPLGSKEARAWIGGVFLQRNKGRNLKRLIEDAVQLLDIKASTAGVVYEVHTRIAGHDGRIYINLMDDAGNVIEVSAEGWNSIINPPVRFISPKNAKPLPMPERGGDISAIDALINVESQEDRNMIVSWLFNAFFPKGPYPVLLINGEQGSAKTTTTKFIRALIDPATALTRSLPGSERDLMVSASNSWVLCYDNLSSLSAALSDALCRIATGAGFGVRQHYSDKGETVFDAARPILGNGIEGVFERLDLLDRTIMICLPALTPEKRRTDEELRMLIQEATPKILGGFMDILSASLKNLPHTEPGELPRMADFAKRVLSIESLLGWETGTFLPYYKSLADASAKEAMEGDHVLQAILQHMNVIPRWEGTASQLHKIITDKTAYEKRKFLPKINKLPLKRLIPALRNYGLELEQQRTGSSRLIVINNMNEGFIVDVDMTSNVMTLEDAKKFVL